MSHDDRTPAQVDQARAEGATVSEFPTTLEAAAHARALGLSIVMGAPNLLRGGSQSGNVSLRTLLEADLCDVLSSDYIPRSPLDAAFAIGFDASLPQDLARAISMVTEAPARLAGLADRGRIAPGLRADLVQVRRSGAHNHVVAVWREGRRVY
ncbi:alpha-D-ribose 1-methylphosphonate 5-triphosphate diphosphatase [Frigidibacter albus]